MQLNDQSNFRPPYLALIAVSACLWAMAPAVAFATVHGPGNEQSEDEIWPRLESPVGPENRIERRIDSLLAQMTVEQKVGQVIQAEIQFVSPDDVRKYHLGSILNGGGSWPGKNKHASPADWVALADAFYHASMDTSGGRLAIPVMWGTDAMHGHSNVYGATLFPHNIGLGATRNPELIRKIGQITAREVAVTGIAWTFAPTVAVARDDRWGRTYESYSEDPDIVREYARQMVLGIQGAPGSNDFLGPDHLVAAAKHFLGDGGTLAGQDQGDTRVSEAELFQIHAQGYVSALEAGVQTVMVSFSSWNGTKMHGNQRLLTEVLKGRMGFDGLLVGDWNGHAQVPGCNAESCPVAFNAGIDLFMAPEQWKGLWHNTLDQVNNGDIPMARLDDAVRRILRVKLRAGLFERGAPSTWPLANRSEVLGAKAHRAVARQAVRESVVLLKNNGQLLPLDPRTRILVAGPGADEIGMQSGGWTLTWQGTGNEEFDFPGATSIYQGIAEAVETAGGMAVLSEDGAFTEKPDVAIVVWGESPYAEFQGDLRHVQFHPGDTRELELLKKLQSEGIPVVSVFLSGRPLWVNPHLNASDAFLAAWLPGSEGGGVADVLFRDADGGIRHDFTGRLSFSWPAEPDQTPLNSGSEPYQPLFAYGYGLSLTDTVEITNELPEQDLELGELQDLQLFVNRVQSPWRMFTLGHTDRADTNTVSWAAPAFQDTDGQADGNPQVRKADRWAQEDSLAISWRNGRPALFGFAQNVGENGGLLSSDLSEYLLSRGALQFDVMLRSGDPGGLGLGMVCAQTMPGCQAEIGLSEVTGKDWHAGQWRSVNVALECLARLGMDFSQTGAPFYLESDRELELLIHDVRIVRGPEKAEPARCEIRGYLE